LIAADVDAKEASRIKEQLSAVGPEQIIVDLPSKKAEAIRILARYPNGSIRIPEFSFNPVKWSDAYELQKRTGYVFCPRDIASIVSLAAKIVFITRYGVVMAEEADGYIKAKSANPKWIPALVRGNVIDEAAAERLTSRRYSLLRVRPEDLKVPDVWLQDDPDFAVRMSVEIQKHLQGGLTAEHMKALGSVMSALYAFVDMWFSGERVTSELADEAALQQLLREAFVLSKLHVEEGSKVGGGFLDLFVEQAILVENKFKDTASDPQKSFPAAGMQGRRYAIALGSQIVVVVGAQRARPGKFPSKTDTVTIRPISSGDVNRVEIRILLPFGAALPSREKANSS
jgi:hypothetical protein